MVFVDLSLPDRERAKFRETTSGKVVVAVTDYNSDPILSFLFQKYFSTLTFDEVVLDDSATNGDRFYTLKNAGVDVDSFAIYKTPTGFRYVHGASTETFSMTTESGDTMITEGGDPLILEA